MVTEEHDHYSRCITCGRWIAEKERIANRFCSEACSRRYITCRSCGTYIEQHKGSADATKDNTIVCPYCGAALNTVKTEKGGEEE
jgi:predicted RNA-binding Zn-ribbon protein involved in translation (DUF1610 family)